MARYDLRLSTEEFLSMTPAQFVCLCDRHAAALEEADYRAALICSVIANVHRPKNRRPYKVRDFMPDRGRGPSRRKEQTWQEQLELVKVWHKLLGGK